MESSNPVLKGILRHREELSPSERMTVQGAVDRSILLTVLLAAAGAFSWYQLPLNPGLVQGMLWGGVAVGFIAVLVSAFKKEWSPIAAPIYAAAQGLALGGISAIYESLYSGIVLQAVLATVVTLFGFLFLYRSGAIRVTEKFRAIVFAATAGIALIYLVNMVMHFFGASIPLIHESGLVGIGFSLVVIVVAALNLVLDFHFIEKASEVGVPKYMEWYAALGLLVTLVWLYLEMLRLLAKLRNR